MKVGLRKIPLKAKLGALDFITNDELIQFYALEDSSGYLAWLDQVKQRLSLSFEVEESQGPNDIILKAFDSSSYSHCLQLARLGYEKRHLFLSEGSKKSPNDLSQKILSLKTPVAYISKGDILYQNRSFSDLNLSLERIRQLIHDQSSAYVVIKGQDDQSYRYQIRVTQNKKGQLLILKRLRGGQSFGEIGIMTSSIAHELNNPLGGIKAALDVLALDDDRSEIKEMASVVDRCQKLVSTFLSFSREHLNEGQKSTGILSEAYDQAIELMKYRYLESQVITRPHFCQEATYHEKLALPLLVMVLYFGLNEALTQYSHRRLLGEKTLNMLHVRLVESERFWSLGFNFNLDKESMTLFSDRLFNFLLQGLKLKLKFKDDQQGSELIFGALD